MTTKKMTAAQAHTKAHEAKRAQRLAYRPMPKFSFDDMRNALSAPTMEGSVFIVGDSNGVLYRLDPASGALRRVKWER